MQEATYRFCAYYRRTFQHDCLWNDKGNTAIIAEMIADETGADIFEILPEEDYYPYTYDELTDVAKQEQKETARPAYAGEVPDFDQYKTVFIGSPVWWGDWPMIMYTFFEENTDALAGKTLIPFSTAVWRHPVRTARLEKVLRSEAAMRRMIRTM